MATIRKRALKNGDFSYLIQVKIREKGSGKQILRTTTWKPEEKMSQKQTERAVAIFASDYENQIRKTIEGNFSVSENPNITFKEFSSKWLEKTERDCSLTYFAGCKTIINLINNYIGGYKLKDLTPAIIQNFYDKLDKLQKTVVCVLPKPEFRDVLESCGYNYAKLRYEKHVQCCSLAHALKGEPISKGWSIGLAEKTQISFDKLFTEKIVKAPYAYESIHKIKRTTRAILSMAKKNRLVLDNYASADFINFPKRIAHNIECMDDESAKFFYNCVIKYPDIRYKTAMLLFLLTGFRRGEVAGLEWKDINLEAKTITVNRSLTTVNGYGTILKEPKTESSKRTISISDTLVNCLIEYKNFQTENRLAFGDYMQANDYVFTQENGKRLNPSSYTSWLNKVLKSAGLDHVSLHSLRHTNITMQIAAGVPLVTVSARAGHARTSTTSDIYAHFIKSSDKTAADIIDKIFNNVVISEKEPDNSDNFLTTEKQQEVYQNNIAKCEKDKSDTNNTGKYLEEYRQMEQDMEKLGFENSLEYLKYLNYKKLKQKKDFEM